MKKITLLALAAAGLLALAGTAQAKEIGSLKVCGANGCNTFSDAEQLKGWEPSGGQTSQSMAPAQNYYSVALGFTDPEGSASIVHYENAYWLPDSALFRFSSTTDTAWWSVMPNQTTMYEKAAAGIEPFKPTLSKVTVKGRAVSDPNSYLALFNKFKYRTLPRGKLKFALIKLTTASPNPWVNGLVYLRYEPKRHLLIRPDGYFTLPAAVGKLVMHRASLKASSTSGSGGGDGGTALYAGIGVGAAAAVAVLAVARRKRMS